MGVTILTSPPSSHTIEIPDAWIVPPFQKQVKLVPWSGTLFPPPCSYLWGKGVIDINGETYFQGGSDTGSFVELRSTSNALFSVEIGETLFVEFHLRKGEAIVAVDNFGNLFKVTTPKVHTLHVSQGFDKYALSFAVCKSASSRPVHAAGVSVKINPPKKSQALEVPSTIVVVVNRCTRQQASILAEQVGKVVIVEELDSQFSVVGILSKVDLRFIAEDLNPATTPVDVFIGKLEIMQLPSPWGVWVG